MSNRLEFATKQDAALEVARLRVENERLTAKLDLLAATVPLAAPKPEACGTCGGSSEVVVPFPPPCRGMRVEPCPDCTPAKEPQDIDWQPHARGSTQEQCLYWYPIPGGARFCVLPPGHDGAHRDGRTPGPHRTRKARQVDAKAVAEMLAE